MIKIYTTSWCPFCKSAKRFLENKGLEFEEIDIEEQGISREQLKRLTGRLSVPQIIIGNKPIGGYEDLISLHQAGKLI